MEIDLAAATARAMHVRRLYEQLERHIHGSSWTPPELMVGYLYDVGELGRLVMGAEGRWMHEGDLPKELADKLAECLWWTLVLSERLDVDMTRAFTAKMDALDLQLTASVARLGNPA